MKSDDLKKLPIEVKSLINDGIYSLYAVAGLAGVAFVLMTNAPAFYALSAEGEVLPMQIKQLDGLNLLRAEHFHDLRSGDALQVNFA